MRVTFALVRLAIGLFFVMLPLLALKAETLAHWVAIAFVCSLLAAFVVAFIEVALFWAGRSSAGRPPRP